MTDTLPDRLSQSPKSPIMIPVIQRQIHPTHTERIHTAVQLGKTGRGAGRIPITPLAAQAHHLAQ